MALYRWSRPRVVNLLLENLYPSSPALPGVQGRATEPASFPRLIPSLVPNTWMRIPQWGRSITRFWAQVPGKLRDEILQLQGATPESRLSLSYGIGDVLLAAG